MKLSWLFVWIIIAVSEMIHGILRARFLAPKVGDLRSRQIGVFSGSLIFYIITYFTFEWLAVETMAEALQLGIFWFFAMLIFEFTIGHYIFKFPWKWLFNDFNILQGRLLALGMIFLLLAPLVIGTLMGKL